MVSTHSRLKAAGQDGTTGSGGQGGFNTQPPEGGWDGLSKTLVFDTVSTHSRLKAAGYQKTQKSSELIRFQHTAA